MIIVQTPLRVSFFGGGTDFPEFYRKYGGGTLSTAINKYIYVVVKSRFDDYIRLTYTKAELVKNIDNLKHDIVRECLKHVGITKGIEVITIGDVPAGSGLGSSSAVTVGVLKALYAYRGVETAAEQLAQEACHIEREILCKPIGIQDQYIAAYGGCRFFEFGKKTKNKEVCLGDIPDSLLLFFTGITRSADKILKVQRKNVAKNINILITMRDLAKNMSKGSWKNDEFGKSLDIAWQMKKELNHTVSSAKIDKLYQKAKGAGALGGKILGAGGGGFLLLYCPDGTKESVRQALSKLTEIPFVPEPDGAKVILNYRT